MKIPAMWWEGDFHPNGVTIGWLLHLNDEGEYVVDRGQGRETICPSEHLVLVAECQSCKQWSMRITSSGSHDSGCIEGGDHYPWEDPFEGLDFSDADAEDDDDE